MEVTQRIIRYLNYIREIVNISRHISQEPKFARIASELHIDC
jgi:hypothetical protein